MKKLCALFVIGLAAGCLPVGEANQIVVDGEASLEFKPEVFSISASIRARTENPEAALAEVSNRLATIRETLPELEALTHLSIEASAAEIGPARNIECMESANYITLHQCPIEGYFGSITLTVQGAPAAQSGRSLSLLSELGAESVTLGKYALNDLEAAQQEALDAAVSDARKKAEKIASAAGATLAGPIRIQYGEGFADDRYGMMYRQAEAGAPPPVSASRAVTPEIDLDLDPQPIEVNAKVVAAFKIE